MADQETSQSTIQGQAVSAAGECQRIGVIVPAALDLGRAILRGVRQYCQGQSGLRFEVISEYGYDPNGLPEPGRYNCVVAHVAGEAAVRHLQSCCAQLVVTSNSDTGHLAPKVCNDDVAVGRMGADYLLGLHYRRLAFLTADERRFSVERLCGFQEMAAMAEVEVAVYEGGRPEHIQEVLAALMQSPGRVAVMAASDLHARWLMEAFEDPLAAIPERVAILGVDNDSLQNEMCPLPLSSVRLSGERIGYEAAALGMRLAAGEAWSGEPMRIAPREVVARQSTNTLMVADPMVARALTLMRERIAELADVGEVVAAMGVPRRTLEWHFRQALKTTMASELTAIRVRRARELISNSDLTLAEISQQVGFTEPRLLSTAFKRASGETPSTYRKRVRVSDGR